MLIKPSFSIYILLINLQDVMVDPFLQICFGICKVNTGRYYGQCWDLNHLTSLIITPPTHNLQGATLFVDLQRWTSIVSDGKQYWDLKLIRTPHHGALTIAPPTQIYYIYRI